MDAVVAISGGLTWVSLTAVIVLLGVTLVMTVVSAVKPRDYLASLGISFFFWLTLAYLMLLVTLAVAYIGNLFGAKQSIDWLIAGVLPIGVPWFGAIGAVLSAFGGIFWQNAQKTWDTSHNYWHIARPFFGAIVATIAFIVFIVVLDAASNTASGGVASPVLPSRHSTATQLFIYYALAFLVGYREDSFRQLIDRLATILFAPGTPTSTETPAPPQGSGVSLEFVVGGVPVSVVDFGDVQVGGSSTRDITFRNTGQQAILGTAFTLATTLPPDADAFKFEPQLAVMDVAANDELTVTVRFEPITAAPHRGALLLDSPSLVAQAGIALRGRGVEVVAE